MLFCCLTSCLTWSALCQLMQLRATKKKWVCILHGAEQRAASGTLLNRAMVQLVEVYALSRIAAISSGDCKATVMTWWNLEVIVVTTVVRNIKIGTADLNCHCRLTLLPCNWCRFWPGLSAVTRTALPRGESVCFLKKSERLSLWVPNQF